MFPNQYLLLLRFSVFKNALSFLRQKPEKNKNKTNTIALCTRAASDHPKTKRPRLDDQPEDQSAELHHQPQDQSAEGPATLPRNRPLTDVEKSTIQEVFADQLRKDQKILLVDVRQVMEGHPTLAALEPFQVMSKRVADYLRYLQTSSVSNVPDQAHQGVAEWVSTTASTGTTASSSLEGWRTTWSKQDQETILQWLATKSKCPGKADVIQAFETEEELKVMLEHKTMQQCLNKVKNLFKTLKAKTKV